METEKPERKKINRLIILGNGFDLSLGLKTSYKNFLYNYLRNTLIKIYEDEESETTGYKDTTTYKYDDGLTKWKVPNDRTCYNVTGEIRELNDYEKLSKYLIESKYLTYEFDLLSKFHDNTVNDNWTDIEILYYDSLVSIVEKYSDNIKKRESLIRIYNDKFDKLKLELVKYLSNVKPPWVEGDNKREIAQYSSNLFHEILESNNDDIQVNDAMILNFNYTNTLQNLSSYFPLNYSYKLNHIHGNIKGKDSVIFGFGDELDKDYLRLESERSKELFKHIKSAHYFQYPNYKELNEFINTYEYEVYILGHSCGISDRTLLNEIFEHENCKSIRIFYHEKDDLTNNKLDIS